MTPRGARVRPQPPRARGALTGTIEMKSRLILNPVSGADDAPELLRAMNERLRGRVGDMDIVMTVAPGDAEHAGEQAARERYDHLFVAGGDGTLNEVLNGAARVPGALARITFGLIPFGTGNDFATSLGLPTTLSGTLDVLLEGHTVHADLGLLDERCFVNVSAGGFIAEVSDAVSPHLKTVAGRLAYLIGGASVLREHEPVRTHIRARGGERPFEREMDLTLFAVCNARMVGGGRLIAPRAEIDDGLLDVCLVEPMKTLEFIALLRRISDGHHLDDARVTYFRASDVELAFDQTTRVNTDGEVLDRAACHYRVLPRAARFLAGRASIVPSDGIDPGLARDED